MSWGPKRALIAGLTACLSAANVYASGPDHAEPPPSRPGSTVGAPRAAAPILTEPLAGTTRDAIGLLSPTATGLPRSLWSNSQAAEIVNLLRSIEAKGVPTARRVFHRILLSESDPPQGSTEKADVLLARIDKLIDMGSIDEAEAMISRAGQPDAALFARLFDIALLTGRADTVCRLMATDGDIALGLASRTYCAVRNRDEVTARLSLRIGRSLEAIDPLRADHLERFIDPQSFQEAPPLEVPTPYTALDHVIREALAMPRPLWGLEPAFLYSDLGRRAPLRDRILSSEQLSRSGDFPYPLLFSQYRARPAAASGGVWERVAAIQALDEALGGISTRNTLNALQRADIALSSAGLRVALSQAYGAALARLPFIGTRDRTMAEVLLLAGQPVDAAAWMPADAPLHLQIADAVANPERELDAITLPPPRSDADQRALAAWPVFEGIPPGGALAEELQDLVVRQRTGAAILRALRLLDAGTEIDPGDFAVALQTLRATGREADARQIMVETVLTGIRW